MMERNSYALNAAFYYFLGNWYQRFLQVRMVFDKFGTLAIQNAWYDASQITDHVIKGYTKVTTILQLENRYQTS